MFYNRLSDSSNLHTSFFTLFILDTCRLISTDDVYYTCRLISTDDMTHSTEQLSAEMANIDCIMQDLNAIKDGFEMA
ncbi:hypothetical protein EB796_017363 [Bugula neritina]|uniref:Uncharacterized protein n=1 Tax=Bugula neritina TaxID=10212 RepID=A0A7J7JDJ6_BUGNE|nr:hypothetical protein EB796_017363 [Bugula neritina]